MFLFCFGAGPIFGRVPRAQNHANSFFFCFASFYCLEKEVFHFELLPEVLVIPKGLVFLCRMWKVWTPGLLERGTSIGSGSETFQKENCWEYRILTNLFCGSLGFSVTWACVHLLLACCLFHNMGTLNFFTFCQPFGGYENQANMVSPFLQGQIAAGEGLNLEMDMAQEAKTTLSQCCGSFFYMQTSKQTGCFKLKT